MGDPCTGSARSNAVGYKKLKKTKGSKDLLWFGLPKGGVRKLDWVGKGASRGFVNIEGKGEK